MIGLLNRQQFENKESDIIKPKASKCLHIDIDNNEKGQNLKKY